MEFTTDQPFPLKSVFGWKTKPKPITLVLSITNVGKKSMPTPRVCMSFNVAEANERDRFKVYMMNPVDHRRTIAAGATRDFLLHDDLFNKAHSEANAVSTDRYEVIIFFKNIGELKISGRFVGQFMDEYPG